MSIKIYKDAQANAIFLEDSNGAQFINAICAREVGGNVCILSKSRDIDLISNAPHTSFIDSNDVPYAGDVTAVVNTLNILFSDEGTTSTSIPVITSSLVINSVVGDVINYELLADFGVGYEWSNLPAGLTTVEGNNRKLIGGSGLTAATYTPTMRAINYNGEDVETLTIVVSAPAFSNTKSVAFEVNDYLDAAASTANPLYRASNGAGAADAWTIATYFKGGTSNNLEQTIVMFGGSSQSNDARVQLFWDNSNGDQHIRLRYGSNNNYLELNTPDLGVLPNVWTHIMVTYDGGTTGVASGSIADYYSRFTIFIDGVSVSLTTSHANYGNTAEVKADYFRVGRNGTAANTLRNDCRLDELSLWDTDQTANVADIHNAGVPHDLAILTTPPTHWWRFGDSDTYPTATDSIGSLDLTLTLMGPSSFVNDVPI